MLEALDFDPAVLRVTSTKLCHFIYGKNSSYINNSQSVQSLHGSRGTFSVMFTVFSKRPRHVRLSLINR